MKNEKRVFQMVAIGLCMMLCVMLAYNTQQELAVIEDVPVPMSSTVGVLVAQTQDDIKVIPDKYNTGAKGDLTVVKAKDTINGISFGLSGDGITNTIDLYRRNPDVRGVITFNNYDFSDYNFSSYNDSLITENVKLVFNNCKFSWVKVGATDANISYEFNNCTIVSFYGSNAKFNYCAFGGTYRDGIIPFRNVQVNNCFISDMSSDEGAGKHTDGTQIYGIAGQDVQNISYDNCRFEIPVVETAANSAGINACLMVQLEYSNANGIWFKDCKINGGGYSIYAHDKNKGWKLENVGFENIEVGVAKMFGPIYYNVSEGVQFINLHETEKLYVGSVWKDEKGTHISVTNDTRDDRTLIVYTGKEKYEYVIPACAVGKTNLQYEEYPFDIDIVLPKDSEYIVCYDATTAGRAIQIRYVNWSGARVYLPESLSDTLFDKNAVADVVLSDMCGKNVSFTLTSDGVLNLSGTGETYNYNSQKLPPWHERKHLIKQVIVAEGITTVGSQIFKDCSNLKSVVLQDGVELIGSRAFANCTFIDSFSIPKSVNTVAKYAFHGALVRNTYYLGTEEEWKQVTVEENNAKLLENLHIGEDAKSSYEEWVRRETPVVDRAVPAKIEEVKEVLLLSGTCGNTISYKLTENGTLILSGSGATYNYNSIKVAPWYSMKDAVKKVVVEEGITVLGSQAFRKCEAIESVQLPHSLVEIGTNCFIGCRGMKEIRILETVKFIGQYAFNGTGLQMAYYTGTEDMWNAISVGIKNEKLLNSITFVK